MISRIKEYLSAGIISFEFLVLVIGLAGVVAWPELVASISSKISSDAAFLKHFALFPIGLAVWIFSEVRKLLLPEPNVKEILLEWPEYWRLKIHFHVTLMYSIIFSIFGVITWALKLTVREPTGFVILTVSVVGQLIVAISVYLARISAEEILSASANNSN